MRRLLGIGLVLCVVLGLSAEGAFARGGGRMGGSPQGMRGGFGGQQSYPGYPLGAMGQQRMQQYRLQNRARAMQYAYGDWLGYGQQQAPYGALPGQFPLGNQLGAIGQQRMMQQRMQNRARAGQGGFGGQGAAQAPQGESGLGVGQCPFGNQPQGLQEQQRRQSRTRAAQNPDGSSAGGSQQRTRARTRVPQ